MIKIEKIFLTLLIVTPIYGWTQTQGNTVFYDPPIPHFKNGTKALHDSIYNNLQVPNSQVDSVTIVFVSYTIDSIGNMKDIRIIKGATDKHNAEALRVVKLLKHCEWVPGKSLTGQPITQKMTLPIRFKLE